MKKQFGIGKAIIGMLALLAMTMAHAKSQPLWTFTPNPKFPPQVTVSATDTAVVKYTVTNHSSYPHQLVIHSQTGVHQVSPCLLGPRGSATATCMLTLNITGSALPTTGIRGGPSLCQTNPNGTPNRNQCYQPNPMDILNITKTTTTYHTISGTVSGLSGTLTLLNNGSNALTISTDGTFTFTTAVAEGSPYDVTVGTQPATQTCSVSNGSGTMGGSNVTNVSVTCITQNTTITVSPTGTIPATSGGTITNTVTVTNNGTMFAALNVHATLPAGWTAVTQDATGCTSIPANGGTCNLVFSSKLPYVAQKNIVITGDNITSPPTMALAFTINGYLVFSVESSTSATVIDTTDLSSSEQWGNDIAPTGAQSLTDGFTNTGIIKDILNIGTSAAVSCYNSTAGGVIAGTWYLPAICQMGGTGQGAGCATGIANIDTNLVQLGFGGLAGSYWSSTEYAIDSIIEAWYQNFVSGGSSSQVDDGKILPLGVRCARALTI